MLNRKCLENICVKRQENLRIITKLDLSSCNIRGIYPGTFKDLVQLKKINLSNNNIVDIHQDTFKDLFQLTHIDLKYNKKLINNNELKLFFEDNVKEIHLRDRNSISQIHNVDIFLLYHSYLSKKLFYSFFSCTITK